MTGAAVALAMMAEDDQIELLALCFAATFGRTAATDADRFVAIDMLRVLRRSGAEIGKRA
jgi:hypothetical protein